MYSFALVIQLMLCAVYLGSYRLQHPHTPAGDVVKRMCEIVIHAAPAGNACLLVTSFLCVPVCKRSLY